MFLCTLMHPYRNVPSQYSLVRPLARAYSYLHSFDFPPHSIFQLPPHVNCFKHYLTQFLSFSLVIYLALSIMLATYVSLAVVCYHKFIIKKKEPPALVCLVACSSVFKSSFVP